MYGQTSLMGLGAQVYIDPEQPWLGMKEVADTGTATGQKTSLLDSALNIFKTLAPVAKDVASTVNQFKSGSGTYNPNLPTIPTYAPAPQQTGMSQGTKVALGIGAAALVGGLVYASRKKKK